MADNAGLSTTTVSRVRRAFGLKPHRSGTFKLCLDPPERALVLCVDEKSQIQALDRSQPVLPMMPRVPERRTADYVRHGTTTLFAALGIATGRVIGAPHRCHRAGRAPDL